MACGLADGATAIIRVLQRVDISPSTTSPASLRSIHVDFDVLDLHASDSDGKGISALAWVDRAEIPQEKVHCSLSRCGIIDTDKQLGNALPCEARLVQLLPGQSTDGY